MWVGRGHVVIRVVGFGTLFLSPILLLPGVVLATLLHTFSPIIFFLCVFFSLSSAILRNLLILNK